MSIVRTAGLYNLKKRLFNYDLIKVIRRHGSVSSVKYIYRTIHVDWDATVFFSSWMQYKSGNQETR